MRVVCLQDPHPSVSWFAWHSEVASLHVVSLPFRSRIGSLCVAGPLDVPYAPKDKIRMGCRWCAFIMTRSNASKSASSRNICILPTDRLRT